MDDKIYDALFDVWNLAILEGNPVHLCIESLKKNGFTIEQDWQDISTAPKEINEYSEHGPYIQIKTSDLGWEEGTHIEKIRTCYWDETVEWWQIDTDGETEYCGLQSAIIGWRPFSITEGE